MNIMFWYTVKSLWYLTELSSLDPWLFKELDQAVVCPKAWSSFNL